jgi:hypothetical protein
MKHDLTIYDIDKGEKSSLCRTGHNSSLDDPYFELR